MIIEPYTWSRLTIATILPVALDTVAVGFTRPADYTFRAGQYAVVRVTTHTGEAYIRQYSFSSAPADEALELLIQHEPGGVASSWFFKEGKVGDVLEFSQPFGSFTLETAADRPVLLIAGRIGIAPFISMLRDGSHDNVSVLYSVSNQPQICYPDLLEQCRATIIRTDSSPRINKTILKKLIIDEPVVYVCGSKQFVDNLTDILLEMGGDARDIKRELFTLQ